MPGKKVPKNLMTGQVFMNLKWQNWNVSPSWPLFKITSQILMHTQKLTPEIPNDRARTSVRTFIVPLLGNRPPPPPSSRGVFLSHERGYS